MRRSRGTAGAMVAVAACVALGEGAHAQSTRATPSLLAEHAELVPGRANWLAVVFDIDRGWHLYWDGRNDSGSAPSLEFELPEGYSAGPALWPTPRRLVTADFILDHVYEDRATLLVPLNVPEGAVAGERVEIGVELSWVVCKEACFAEGARLELSLTVGRALEESASPPPRHSAAFARARAALPKPLPEDGSGPRLEWSGDTLIVAPPPDVTGALAAFYPAQRCADLVDVIRDGEARDGTLRLRLVDTGERRVVRGVAAWLDQRGRTRAAYTLNVPEPPPAPE